MPERFLENLKRGADELPRLANVEAGSFTDDDVLEAALSTCSEAAQPAEVVLRALGRRLEAAACELWSAPTGGGQERLERRWSDSAHAPPHSNGGDVGPQHAAPIADTCEFVEWIEDVEGDARVCGDTWLQRSGVRSMLRAPVRTARESFGTLRLYFRERRPRDVEGAKLVGRLGDALAQCCAQRRAGPTRDLHSGCWRTLTRVTFDAIVVIDPNARIVELNRAAESLLGRERSALVGHSLLKLAVPERLRALAAERLAAQMAGVERSRECRRFGGTVLRADGEELAVDIAVVALDPDEQDVLLVCASPAQRGSDGAPDAGRTHAQLRSLMTALLIAEERERQRLAQDLHDGLSQTIALAQMKLASLRASTQIRSAAARETLDQLRDLIASADRSARSIGFELSPPSLHQLGLAPALRWLVESLHVRYGIAIEFDEGEALAPMDGARRVIVFRAIRELLINAAKHSGESLVRLSLRQTPEHLAVCVSDVGVGMAAESAVGAGTGLLSIRERLAHLGGSLRIRSAPGRGATIEFEMPMSRSESKELRGP